MRRLICSAKASPIRRLLFVASATLFGVWLLFDEFPYSNVKIQGRLQKPIVSWSDSLSPDTSPSFWESFAPLLAAATPRCPPPQLLEKAHANYLPDIPSKEEAQTNYINMSKTDIESMRRSHAWFIAQINTKAPDLEYKPGTLGIVTTAGGSYFPTLLVSLQMLRRTGSTLPVEVFLSNRAEYEPLICDDVLPTLNAKCIVLSDLIDGFLLPFLFEKYQLKVFAMLFSSFESLLFLDADNFPVYPPESLFLSEPFTSHHLVLWPDFWSPTVSPLFSAIIGLKDTYFEHTSIESGQILLSKPYHSRTLLLAAYYNCYNDYFYPLLSQGGPGEGDKETFGAAALVLNMTFYTVMQLPQPLGVRKLGGAATLQADPVTDFISHHHHYQGSKMPSTEIGQSRPFFVHASWPPKLNALRNIRKQRQWGTVANSIELFNGTDLEPTVWGFMVEMACKKGLEFADWGDKKETNVCEQTKQCFKDMFEWDYEVIGEGIEQ